MALPRQIAKQVEYAAASIILINASCNQLYIGLYTKNIKYVTKYLSVIYAF